MMEAIDYVSPGLEYEDMSVLFPNRVAKSVDENNWPYLRRTIKHRWYVDQRQPSDGFINVDETSLLVALASIVGGRGLEIGALRGWSTVHLAKCLKRLDSVDPIYDDANRYKEIKGMLVSAGVWDHCFLHGGHSPAAIESVSDPSSRWSFVFIDGDHEGLGPRLDAEAVFPHLAPTCVVVFHDLMSPDVLGGLSFFIDQGWQCRIYQTMQIMGVAVRGRIVLPSHLPDPSQEWNVPDHLAKFSHLMVP